MNEKLEKKLKFIPLINISIYLIPLILYIFIGIGAIALYYEYHFEIFLYITLFITVIYYFTIRRNLLKLLKKLRKYQELKRSGKEKL